MYYYHFIIKDLAKVFDGKFECVGENAEKYLLTTYKTITYNLKFVEISIKFY